MDNLKFWLVIGECLLFVMIFPLLQIFFSDYQLYYYREFLLERINEQKKQ